MDPSTNDVTPIPVSQILIRDDDGDNSNKILAWTRSDGTEDTVTTNSMLFALDLTASGRGFITCLLREKDSIDGDCPQLLLLSTEAPPPSPSQVQPVMMRQLPSQLKEDIKVDIIVSTRSGTGLGPTFWRKVLRPLLHLVCDAFGGKDGVSKYPALLTRDAQDVNRFGKSLWEGRRDGSTRLVVLLSGDGGVADLLAGYGVEEAVTKPMIALLPLGTGNALFHSLHRESSSNSFSSPLVQGIRTLFFGQPAQLPIFRTTFSSPNLKKTNDDDDDDDDETATTLYGVVVASYGFHASLIHESDTPEHRLQGAKRFSVVAESLLAEDHEYEAEVRVNDEVDNNNNNNDKDRPRLIPQRKHAYVLISMVSNLERTFVISPKSRPLDDRLHLVRFGNVGPRRIMDVMRQAYQGGKHVDLRWDDGEEVSYHEVDEVLVKLLDDHDRWRKVCVDGTIVEVPKGGSVTIAKTEARPFRILVDDLALRPP